MRWTYQYCENKNAFSDCRKMSAEHSGSWRSSGSEFQTVGGQQQKTPDGRTLLASWGGGAWPPCPPPKSAYGAWHHIWTKRNGAVCTSECISEGSAALRVNRLSAGSMVKQCAHDLRVPVKRWRHQSRGFQRRKRCIHFGTVVQQHLSRYTQR